MNKSKKAWAIKIVLYLLFTINSLVLLLLSQRIIDLGLRGSYPWWLNLVACVSTLVIWFLISTFLVVIKYEKLKNQQLIIFIMGIVFTVCWFPLMNPLQWWVFPADTVVVFVISGSLYLLNIIFVNKKFIVFFREKIKKEQTN